MDQDVFLTVKQLAELLQVSKQAIRKWAREDMIPHLKVGVGITKDYRFNRKEILDFFKAEDQI